MHLRFAWRLCLASVLAALAPAQAQDFDTGADNLIAVLRESPGANHQLEKLLPMGPVKARLADGRDVEIDASWFHYLGDMHVRLVFDGERSMQTAAPEDLRRLELAPEQAITRAVDNLRRRYGVPQVRPWSGGLMQVVSSSPDLASSYFLDREFWSGLLQQHPEGLVVSVPQRSGLLYASASDEAAIVNLRFSAAALYAGNDRNRLSSALFLFKDGHWSVYQPPQQVSQAGRD